MGYTHYHPQNRAFTQIEWSKVTAATVKIIKRAKQYDIDIDNESIGGEIFLNGSEAKKEAYETFVITRDFNPEYAFCKTARKPYDLVVCMILMACHNLAPGALKITSDGVASDWYESRQTYKSLFRIDSRLPWV